MAPWIHNGLYSSILWTTGGIFVEIGCFERRRWCSLCLYTISISTNEGSRLVRCWFWKFYKSLEGNERLCDIDGMMYDMEAGERGLNSRTGELLLFAFWGFVQRTSRKKKLAAWDHHSSRRCIWRRCFSDTVWNRQILNVVAVEPPLCTIF